MAATKTKATTISKSSGNEFYFDEVAAERAVKFFADYITHVEGDVAGQPYILQDWEKNEVIRPIFGWKRKDTGRRRYRKVFIYVARKNSKTTLATGIGIYMAYGFDHVGAQIFNAAATSKQASISFDIAKKMIDQKPVLKRASKLYYQGILRLKTWTRYKVLSSDGESQHGYNSYCSIIDELHAHKKRSLYDALVTSRGTQKEPLTIITTTAGYDKTSLCYSIYKYAKGVKSGQIKDDTFLPVIYEADENDDPYDPKTWAKANPSLGFTVTLEALQEEFNTAKYDPSYLNVCKRMYLNLWTKAENIWILPQIWASCNYGKIDISQFGGRICFIGCDLANTGDLVAVSYFFPGTKEGDKHNLIVDYWVTDDKAKHRKTLMEADYYAWRDQGYVTIVSGNSHDYDLIRGRINQVASMCKVQVVGYDLWNSKQFANSLVSDGANINEWPPHNWARWSEPTKELYKMAVSGNINHGGNPILEWNIENVVIKYKAGVVNENDYIMPNKAASKDKIDGVMSSIIAIGEWMNYTTEPPKSHGLGL